MKTIEQMLKEDTGSHFLDSGGAYGRNHERNQEKNFEDEPRVSYEIWNGEINFTVSIYHYLSEVLSENGATEMFNSYLNDLRVELKDSDEYPHWVQECADVIGEYDVEFIGDVFNTYNGENYLSQIFMGQIFKYNDEPYVIISIHGGCDVRGGYTDAKVFKLEGYLTPCPDVMGNIDGKDVSTMYNGYSLTYDENDESVEGLTEDADISLDFYVMEDTCVY